MKEIRTLLEQAKEEKKLSLTLRIRETKRVMDSLDNNSSLDELEKANRIGFYQGVIYTLEQELKSI